MYAIVKTGGKQYKVAAGDVLTVEKLAGSTGDTVVLEEILMVNSEGTVDVGHPTLAQAKVTAEIISQTKAKKNIIFKSKRRKGYQKKTGHRQPITRIKIKEIQFS
jgi:large subunit ribosomal protein L21